MRLVWRGSRQVEIPPPMPKFAGSFRATSTISAKRPLYANRNNRPIGYDRCVLGPRPGESYRRTAGNLPRAAQAARAPYRAFGASARRYIPTAPVAYKRQTPLSQGDKSRDHTDKPVKVRDHIPSPEVSTPCEPPRNRPIDEAHLIAARHTKPAVGENEREGSQRARCQWRRKCPNPVKRTGGRPSRTRRRGEEFRRPLYTRPYGRLTSNTRQVPCERGRSLSVESMGAACLRATSFDIIQLVSPRPGARHRDPAPHMATPPPSPPIESASADAASTGARDNNHCSTSKNTTMAG